LHSYLGISRSGSNQRPATSSFASIVLLSASSFAAKDFRYLWCESRSDQKRFKITDASVASGKVAAMREVLRCWGRYWAGLDQVRLVNDFVAVSCSRDGLWWIFLPKQTFITMLVAAPGWQARPGHSLLGALIAAISPLWGVYRKCWSNRTVN